MPQTKITWIALPNGIDASTNALKVSVFVSPRLTDGTTLGQFPPFDQNWPAQVKQLTFQVEMGGAVFAAPPAPADATQGVFAPDEALWALLFNANTPVTSYTFRDYSRSKIFSFPLAKILDHLRATYRQVGAASPTAFPTTDPANQNDPDNINAFINALGVLAGYLDPPVDFDAEVEQAHEQVAPGHRNVASKGVPWTTRYTSSLPSAPNGISDTTFAYAFLQRFYRRTEDDVLEKEPPPPAPPEFDFHSILGVLGDYPMLLRRLGFVLDLQVPYTGALPASSTIRVLPTGLDGPQHLTPRTNYVLNANAGRFLARSRNVGAGNAQSAGIADGFLSLDNPDQYRLVQVDVDGSALKNLGMAASRYLQLKGGVKTSYAIPDRTSLPALREAGLAVAKTDRAYQLGQDITANAQINAAIQSGQTGSLVFFSENVLHGYRVDVYDVSEQQWYSLCRRVGRYRFNENPTHDLVYGGGAESDEGYVKVSSAASKPDDPDKDLYLHEALFQWDGWSLVAERPGKTIVTDEMAARDQALVDGVDPNDDRWEKPAYLKQKPPAAFELEAYFIPKPGSLPVLRYGRTYRVRARIVDLAGNSVDPGLPGMDHATEAHTFRRFHPVAAPVLQLTSVLTEGEAVERMVIRSNYDQATQAYVTDADVQNATSGTLYHPYPETSARHVVPPKTSQLTAERHGVFDAAMGPGQSSTAYQAYLQVGVREKGTLMDPAAGLQLVDLGTQTVAPFAGLPPGEPLTDPDAPYEGQRYLLHTEAQLALPYLPDVFARGTAFVGLPGHQGVWKQSFNNVFATDPTAAVLAEPFRIRIVEGTGAPQFTSDRRVLDVYLPKGTIATVRYSSYFDEAALEQMGMTEWLGAAAVDQHKALILEGRHWMFTPWRELTLVHAVQQPLQEPEFLELDAKKRFVGEPFAFLTGDMRLDLKSTGQIDFLATWADPVDEPTWTEDEPPRDGRDGRQAPPLLQGRVLEMPVEPYYGDLDHLRFPIFDGQFPPPPDPAAWPHADHYEEDFFRHEFGDTKYHRVRYRLVATSRFREYFPAEIYEARQSLKALGLGPSTQKINHRISRVGEEVEKEILSSARPDAAEILYVVPTFGWVTEPLPDGRQSRRRGGGLRVYLKRGWYSSGEGELLGVVLREGGGGNSGSSARTLPLLLPASSVEQDDPLRIRTTQWGLDPVWETSPPPPVPSTASFPRAVDAREGGLTLAEVEGPTVGVAGHEVHFDAERNLWYCDIEVDVGDAYYPFIRFALARYQPHSIDYYDGQKTHNVHLSRIVLTDFIQPASDRTAAVTFEESNKIKVTVSGPHGVSEASRDLIAEPDEPERRTFERKQRTDEPRRRVIGRVQRFTETEPVNPRIRRSRRMLATVEARGGSGPEPAWTPVSDALSDVELEPIEEIEGRALWQKTLQLPPPPGGASDSSPATYRLVLREKEIIYYSSQTKVGVIEGPGEDTYVQYPPLEKEERIVYADAIELNPPA